MLKPQNQIQKDIAKRFIVKNIESQILFDYNKLKEFKLYSNLTLPYIQLYHKAEKKDRKLNIPNPFLTILIFSQ